MATFVPRKLAFMQLPSVKGDIYNSGSVIGEVHNLILFNNNTTPETVVINLNDGVSEFPIIEVTLVPSEAFIHQFVNDGLVVDTSSKLTGQTTTAGKVTCLVIGIEYLNPPLPPIFTFTYTAGVSTKTVTIDALTIVDGETVGVDWGDGTNDEYTGSGTRSHDYADTGVWTVMLSNREAIRELSLNGAAISFAVTGANPMPRNLTKLLLSGLSNLVWPVGPDAPMPTGLLYLYLYSLPNLTWTVGLNAPMPTGLTYLHLQDLFNNNLIWVVGLNAPMPTGLTTLYLNEVPNLTWMVGPNAPMLSGLTSLYLYGMYRLTWEINDSNKWPVGSTYGSIYYCDNVTITAWTNNAVHSFTWISNCNAAKVDSILRAFWLNKANFVDSAPILTLSGNNQAPTGIHRYDATPSTGKEYQYALEHTAPGHNWVVATS